MGLCLGKNGETGEQFSQAWRTGVLGDVEGKPWQVADEVSAAISPANIARTHDDHQSTNWFVIFTAYGTTEREYCHIGTSRMGTLALPGFPSFSPDRVFLAQWRLSRILASGTEVHFLPQFQGYVDIVPTLHGGQAMDASTY